MAHDSVALVRRWFDEVWNQRRVDVIDELLTDESVCHADDGPMRGAQGFRERQYEPLLAAFPDLQIEVEAAVAEGDQVVVRWVATGSHTGGGLGFGATNEAVSFRGVSWVHVRDGKMTEGWVVSNIPDVIRGLAARAAV